MELYHHQTVHFMLTCFLFCFHFQRYIYSILHNLPHIHMFNRMSLYYKYNILNNSSISVRLIKIICSLIIFKYLRFFFFFFNERETLLRPPGQGVWAGGYPVG